MKPKLKIKDLVLIALLTAIYLLIYMASMVPISLLGPYGHAISPGVCALLSGAVLLFMNRKIGKMWEFTCFTLLVMGAFALMGGGYLPWLITSVTAAVAADLLASHSNETSVPRLAIASGILHVGQALGGIIPATFLYHLTAPTGSPEGYLRQRWMATSASARGSWVSAPRLSSSLWPSPECIWGS